MTEWLEFFGNLGCGSGGSDEDPWTINAQHPDPVALVEGLTRGHNVDPFGSQLGQATRTQWGQRHPIHTDEIRLGGRLRRDHTVGSDTSTESGVRESFQIPPRSDEREGQESGEAPMPDARPVSAIDEDNRDGPEDETDRTGDQMGEDGLHHQEDGTCHQEKDDGLHDARG